jgi:hypothetical protein
LVHETTKLKLEQGKNMRQVIAAFAVVCLGLAASSTVSAAPIIVNFDDLVGFGTVADGYGGINWGGVWQYYDDFQPPYTPHSASTRIYNDPRVSDQPFDFVMPNQVFNGGWFSGPPGFARVGFDLYDDGVIVWSTPRTLISDVPLFVASGYGGPVDQVRVFSSQGNAYVLDDVTYGDDSAPVPEPGSLLLIGAGLAGIGVRKWRRRQRAS